LGYNSLHQEDECKEGSKESKTMGYETNADRKKYQKCDNCIFNMNCLVQDTQRFQEDNGLGNTCLYYQDERDLPEPERTARYQAVTGLPPYTVRLRKPI
jgi:hypothetical protein